MWTTQASHISKAAIQTVWKLWAEVGYWKLWDKGIEACWLEGPFITGSKGFLTPKGAPALPYVLTEVIPLERFSDHTELPGAVLEFSHRLKAIPEGTLITHRVEISGPAWQDYAILVRELERDLPNTLASLAALAESWVEA